MKLLISIKTVFLIVTVPRTWALDIDGYHSCSVRGRVTSVPWSLGLGLRPCKKFIAPIEEPGTKIPTKKVETAFKPEFFPPNLESKLDSSELQNMKLMKASPPSDEHHTSVFVSWPTNRISYPANAMSPASQTLDEQSSYALPSPAITNAGQEYSWMYIVVQSEPDTVQKPAPSTPTPGLATKNLNAPPVRRRRPAAWSLGLGLAPPPPPSDPPIIPGGPSSMRAPQPPTPPPLLA